ncbi:unnamed protein product [Phytophthora fragariaefolia]|uniref:Unnamed protein product n=1 Tax=Phytophthora fragariaefolia TaxID=1490495 RepID=A0A9W6WWZ0_9STRA|nr:unnamed protein product [Phytophthora fragariaefolia]
MQQMRKMVAALELQKHQLIIAGRSPLSDGSPREQCASPSTLSWSNLVPTSSSRCSSSSTSITRDDYVQLAAEVEEFRRQNAAMIHELAKRDLFNNSLRYRLASFPPSDSRSSMQPTQLTQEEGVAYVWQTLKLIHDARLCYASEKCFQNRPTFLGWSQYSERQGNIVTFGVKKALHNVTPQQLMDRTWQMQINSDNLCRLGPSHLRTHITLLQKVSNNILVIDRRTEDQSRTNASGKPLILRTMYVLFRVGDDNGTCTMSIKTLDVPETDRMLRDDEVWWDIFYWIRVSPANVANGHDVVTVTEFGGTNSCACEDLASSRLKELIFLVIRWETLAVAPFLLQQ